MNRIRLSIVLAIVVLSLGFLPAEAGSPTFPDTITLPVGFRPEGITVGRGTIFYTGSLANGAIFRGDLLTGEGGIFIPGEAGMVSVGMAYDNRSDYLFVAGGPTGLARIFDASTGELVASYQLADPGNFINDVIITKDATYFTNSSQAFLYRIPLEANGSLPSEEDIETLTLSGDWVQVPSAFNANGIEATFDDKWLIIVNSTRGELYRVDPTSGEAFLIDMGGESVSNGDGLRFRGSLLYVMRNRINTLVAIDFSNDLTSGTVVDTFSYDNFDVPTTLAAFGDVLYTVNAKFTSANPNTLPFEVVRIPLK